MTANRYIRFDKPSSGTPAFEQFSLHEEDVRELKEGEYLIRNHYIAMDPALVGRLRQENNYAECVRPGDKMHAYCVGEVLQSESDRATPGQWLYGRFDMQEYTVANDQTLALPIDPGLAPVNWYLSVLGTTGATAYFAFKEICEPKRGECLVVSSAASSVGSIVAQLARKSGCHVVGIVSTEEKAAQTKVLHGYDAVVSYRDKSISELQASLAECCPGGIDMYFDNTSGDISESLLDLYSDQARIAVVGRMGLSHLSDTSLDVGRRDNSVILAKRIKKQGFVVTDYLPRFAEAVGELKNMIDSGDLKIREDVLEGIGSAPEAFMRMIEGKNDGKQLVKLC